MTTTRDETAGTYWHRAAQLLRTRLREEESDVSSLSEEVLTEGKAHRHWRQVAQDTREALDDAQRYIEALEQDREADRVDAYKRARAHVEAGRPMDEDEAPADAALPAVDPAAPGLRTRWFRTRADALRYAGNAGFRQQPEQRRVWVDLAWREEWSLRVPAVEVAG